MSAPARPFDPAAEASGSLRLMVPSWLASLVLHVGGLLLFVSTLKSCGQGGTSFERGEDFRIVGIVLKEDGNNPDADNPDSHTPHDDANPPAAAGSATAHPAMVPRESPVPLELPQQSSIVGPGPPAFSPASASAADIAAEHLRTPGRGTTGPLAGAPSMAGEVDFFGISDKATRVVYVLDRSGSMTGAPLQFAKAELIASLATLQSNQHFQVIFYNNVTTPMQLEGEADVLYRATDVNRTKTQQYINGIDAAAGTRDLPAILKALHLQPEVIFLLTDGEGLSAADLSEIRAANRSGARIHCVRFGKGPELAGGSYIERLARENGGTYIYRDIQHLDRR